MEQLVEERKVFWPKVGDMKFYLIAYCFTHAAVMTVGVTVKFGVAVKVGGAVKFGVAVNYLMISDSYLGLTESICKLSKLITIYHYNQPTYAR